MDGLEQGLYHYLPMDHELELLDRTRDKTSEVEHEVQKSLCEQKWAGKASLIFFYSIIPYRGEWRYAFDAHRVMMMDAGHVTGNLYLSCSALGLGTCAIAAVDSEAGSRLFSLDGEEEFIFYAAPVGTISKENEAKEQEFYSFLKEDENEGIS